MVASVWHDPGGAKVNRRPRILWQEQIDPRSQSFWNRIELSVSGLEGGAMLYLMLFDAQGDALTESLFPSQVGAEAQESYELLCFIPPAATEARIFSVGTAARMVQISRPTFRPISRIQASTYLLRRSRPAAMLDLLRSSRLRPRALLQGIRHLLLTASQAAHVPPQDYASWVALFDTWNASDFPASLDQPSVAYLVFARETESQALRATLQSLDAQFGGTRYVVVRSTAALSTVDGLEKLDATYIGILQAGEVLPQHATLMAAEQLQQLGRPEIAICDEDDIDASGRRHSPRFKPRPSQATMLSGLLSHGLWLVRRDLLSRYAPVNPIEITEAESTGAEVLRLELWLARHRAGGGDFSTRIPFLLTHRRPDTEAASPALLAAVAERHLRHKSPAIVPVATWPLTFALEVAAIPLAKITVIVPSTLRQPHSLSCIQAILQGTDYPQLDLHVVVMQPGPFDAAQEAAADILRRQPNVTVTHLTAPRFNFSAANNHVAARTESDHILLLNDDVSPIRRDWLLWMAAFLQDPEAGIVGARLLYPDNRVQHGGVIMGLAGLCEHAHRYLPGSQPGYMSRAILAQEMSVVTGACMLVRRSLFERVGGLDVGYPSAFNDVDFALRVGETGHSVIYAPQAELYHHELQTYGSHYAGEREAFQQAEVRRMRQRWDVVCADDPFHNPNLGLSPHCEWKLAFPPRVDREGILHPQRGGKARPDLMDRP
jgi:GT2 family glycosyltransferase